VRGRCPAYGEGITYWPVVEVVKQLDALPEDDAAADAIRSLLGEDNSVAGTDEIAWAFRKLLDEQAPLVVCFDDIQWGEETFLDLVESTALLSAGAPLLLLCVARPELLDRRPSWPGASRLAPLPEDEAGALVGDVVGEKVRERIIRAAGGNPLFLTEMVSLSELGGGDVEVPATLRALLAARLDQLGESERKVLERGAVEGELFHRGSVQALASEETEVTTRLAALVRRELVRPDRPVLPREDAYRFRHLLIRDAAYEALPKSTRVELHRRFAAWLENHGQTLVELDEVLGYHLEQAARYLVELGRPDPAVALSAGDRLATAGRRAHSRGDALAAVTLLERSLELTRPHRLDVHLEIELGEALWSVDLPRAAEIANTAAGRAEAEGDEAGAALARAFVANMRVWAGQIPSDEAELIAREALPLLEAEGDDLGLTTVWSTIAVVANSRSRFADWTAASEAALAHHRRAGRPASHTFGVSVALAFGPRPAAEALAALDAVLPERPYPGDQLVRALLLAMVGLTEEAWAVALSADERARELGQRFEATWTAAVAVLIGDLPAAVGHYEVACEAMEDAGSSGGAALSAAALSHVLSRLGRYEEAGALLERWYPLRSRDDLSAEVDFRRAQALVYSASSRHVEATQLAEEAVSWARRSDSPIFQGDSLYDLGEVLEEAGRRRDAVAAWGEALKCYERKEIVPLVRRVRERLEELQPA
jgi:hypothetical protein